ncbi:shikimate kinase [Candidatus Binatus sp.]|jgi:shikimate kinase|uniref:shikimate kinase n=1 Tax=Candidatus Binatus sp. TaxID=2811406 RepID=UPI003BE3C3D0
MTPKLILTGFMATGKSSVGPLVARRLGWEFVDVDSVIVAQAGKPIAQIFADHGEARFRRLEREVVAHLTGDRRRCPLCHGPHPEVISTGGGVLLDESNCAALKRAGVIVCLTAQPEVVAARVERSKTRRPKLTEGGKSTLARIKELMDERVDAYARADVQIDTSDLTVDQLADQVIAAFAAHAARRCLPSADGVRSA